MKYAGDKIKAVNQKALIAHIKLAVIPIRIVFCDDEHRALEVLEGYVKEYFDTPGTSQPEFASYHSGEELMEHERFVDIAFLDVKMPGLNGIQTGNYLKKNNSAVKIFIVTSYPEYLDEAMEFQVFRFLSKPIDKARLFRNLKDAVYQYAVYSKTLLINIKDGVYAEDSRNIICIESDGRKTLVYTTETVIPCPDSLETWNERLSSIPCFYRTYRSYIINFRYVYKINRDSVVLRYGDEEKAAYLAKRRYSDFREKFMLFLESTK